MAEEGVRSRRCGRLTSERGITWVQRSETLTSRQREIEKGRKLSTGRELVHDRAPRREDRSKIFHTTLRSSNLTEGQVRRRRGLDVLVLILPER